MKQVLTALFILFALCACSQPAAADLATATTTPVPTTATPEPSPTLSPVDALLEEYFAGEEIDVSGLNPEQFSAFSSRLAEHWNAERGFSVVVFDNGDENTAYMDQSLEMKPYNGQPAEDKIIKIFLPVAGINIDGNIQVEQNGEIITINNSAQVDWNSIINDPGDTRIEWPNGKAGRTLAWNLTESPNKIILKPAILLDKTVHAFLIENHGMNSGIRILTVEETDANGLPILLRVTLALNGPLFILMEEDSDFQQNQTEFVMEENDPFYLNLTENNVYYIGFYNNLDDVYKEYMFGASVNNYQGIVSGNEALAILTNQQENKKDFLVAPISIFIKRTN